MKDTELITFENQDIGQIRGFIKDGEPWFLAGQICRCLGIKNTAQAVDSVTERYKIAGLKGISSTYTLLETDGGKQKVLIIPEPFLYELIFQSRKQKAIQFRAWVTTEVLPKIRRTGQYRMAGKLIRRALTDEILDSGENERMHGHGFSTYSRLINKSLGLSEKNNRDELSTEILEKIAMRENTVQALMREGKKYNDIKAVIERLSVKIVEAG
jgi:prophage antirepressor-like protein